MLHRLHKFITSPIAAWVSFSLAIYGLAGTLSSGHMAWLEFFKRVWDLGLGSFVQLTAPLALITSFLVGVPFVITKVINLLVRMGLSLEKWMAERRPP